MQKHHQTIESGLLNNKNNKAAYTSNALREIGERAKHDQGLRQMQYGTIKRIKELKLNCKPIRKRCKWENTNQHPTCANKTNLITIKKKGYKGDMNIIFTTCNIQSIKFKELQVRELIHEYSLNFLVVTETWLEDKHKEWKDTTTLNRDGLSMITADRLDKKGGGLALIYKSYYKVQSIEYKIYRFSEHATWDLRIGGTSVTIHGVYHPPQSPTNKLPNTVFIDQFLEFVSTTLPNHQNNLYIRDFNLHVSDATDTDAAIFNDSIDAMGLYQHVSFPTHKAENTIDLIISDIHQENKILTTSLGPYLIDHRAVLCTLNTKKLRPKYGHRTVRNTSKITKEQWQEQFNSENIRLSNKLDHIVQDMNTELK